MIGTRELPGLAAAELSAVVFVSDYIQLQFDGPVLTAFTLPTVVCRSVVRRCDDAGYRDALCTQIGKTVSSAVATEEAIDISFADGSLIQISLDRADSRTSESAIFRETDGGFWVW